MDLADTIFGSILFVGAGALFIWRSRLWWRTDRRRLVRPLVFGHVAGLILFLGPLAAIWSVGEQLPGPLWELFLTCEFAAVCIANALLLDLPVAKISSRDITEVPAAESTAPPAAPLGQDE